MDLIICSSHDPIKNEQDLVKILFELELECFHLRKPNYSEVEMKTWLEQMDENLRSKIVIHSHYTLAKEYRLKGIHIGARALQNMSKEELNHWIETHPKTISSSAHNMKEAKQLPNNLAYVWLSPIFESISKVGYTSTLKDEELDTLKEWIQTHKKTKVLALGGITATNIPNIIQRAYNGVVILGSLWNNIESLSNIEIVKQRFLDLQKAC